MDPSPVSEAASEDGDVESSRKTSFTRRLLGLLHTEPIHDLEANKAQRGELARYDFITLQLLGIDYITDNMSLEAGSDYQATADHLARLAREVVPERPKAEYQEVAAVVIRSLANGGRGPVVRQVTDDQGEVRQIEVLLVSEELGATGEIELRATPQAINLYVDAFDTDIESTQDAYRTMLQAQLQRGRLGKAADTALVMQKLSKRFQEEVRTALHAAQRDITRIDWSGQIMKQIDAAFKHVRDSAGQLDDIRDDLRNRVAAEDVADNKQRLVEIADRIDASCKMHWELFAEVQGARTRLLEQHAQQVLQPTASLASVDVDREILDPALRLRGSELGQVLAGFFTGTIPPGAEVFDAYTFVAHLWRDRKERQLTTREVREIELLDTETEPPLYTESEIAAARRILAGPLGGRRLSRLLQEAGTSDQPAGVHELLVAAALFAFGTDEGLNEGAREAIGALLPPGVRAERTETDLDWGQFTGDDLIFLVASA